MFKEFEEKYRTENSTGSVTPTLCRLCGVRPPKQCSARELPAVVDQGFKLFGGEGRAEKVLVYCPDAFGEAQCGRCPDAAARVKEIAGFRFRLATVMPSVTPVCFATIFSGAEPAVHGITAYAKPVLTVETLFDVLAEAGKNVAIVSGNGCSIDKIFRERDVDYFSLRTSRQTFECTRRLIAADRHDVIISYMPDYDENLHRTGQFSPTSLEAIARAADWFAELNADMEKYWAAYNRVLVFSPDHGGHAIDEATGGHGTDCAEDMVVNHFYRLRAGKKQPR